MAPSSVLLTDLCLAGLPEVWTAAHIVPLTRSDSTALGSNCTNFLQGPNTAHVRTLAPKTMPCVVFGTRVLEWHYTNLFGLDTRYSLTDSTRRPCNGLHKGTVMSSGS